MGRAGLVSGGSCRAGLVAGPGAVGWMGKIANAFSGVVAASSPGGMDAIKEKWCKGKVAHPIGVFHDTPCHGTGRIFR